MSDGKRPRVGQTPGALGADRWNDTGPPHEQAPQSRAGTRDVPIIPQLHEHLSEHRRRTGRMAGALVFGRTAAVAFSTSSIDRRAKEAWGWKQIRRKGEPVRWEPAVENPYTPVGLHLARHTCVSFMAAAGVPITDAQTFAGHSDPRTTQGIYTHTLPGAEAQVAEKVGAWLAGRATVERQ